LSRRCPQYGRSDDQELCAESIESVPHLVIVDVDDRIGVEHHSDANLLITKQRGTGLSLLFPFIGRGFLLADRADETEARVVDKLLSCGSALCR